MKMNVSGLCARFPVCAETQLEVMLVIVLRDMQTRAAKNQRGVKVGQI